MPEKGKDERVVDEDKVEVKSFKDYKSSDDDRTRVVDGEKEIESFHLYKTEDDDHNDHNHHDVKNDKKS